jgi:putative endopeptidase
MKMSGTSHRGDWKCPCCKNPWNNSANATNLPQYAMACTPCLQSSNGIEGINPLNFDEKTSLKEDFFQWSNGGWVASNPIPNEYSEWNTFLQLRDLNLERIREILNELELNQAERGNDQNNSSEEEKKLKMFYKGMMNETVIESLGIEPLRPIVDLCSMIKSNPSKTLAILHLKYGVDTFFDMSSSPDKVNSNFTIGTISQSGLGLPDRDYYFDEDKAEIREKYRQYIAKVFQLLGTSGFTQYQSTDESFWQRLSESVFHLEAKLAKSHLTRTQRRDPKLTYNKFSISALDNACAPPLTWSRYLARGVSSAPPHEFSWKSYLNHLTPRDLGDMNISTIEAIKTAVDVINFTPIDQLIHYLVFHIALHFSAHLPNEFTLLHFDFFERTLKGTQELKPRWKRALESLEVSFHFPAPSFPLSLCLSVSLSLSLSLSLSPSPSLSPSSLK